MEVVPGDPGERILDIVDLFRRFLTLTSLYISMLINIVQDEKE